MSTLLHNAIIVNEDRVYVGSLLIEGNRIKALYEGKKSLFELPPQAQNAQIIRDCENLLLFPGLIDDQVHFRDPGLTHKGDIESESKAAIAGGITSYMEMPNTKPPTITLTALEDKLERAKEVSYANYSFFVGGTNDNASDIFKIDPHIFPGYKLFLGSSTGNMLVDNDKALDHFFAESPKVIAIHSESESIIRRNKDLFIERFGEDPPIDCHPLIRSEEACYRSTNEAIDRATRYGTHLHVLHISTAKEADIFENDKPLSEKKITAEACVHHLYFTDKGYRSKGTLIKWNPAIKTAKDRDTILEALVKNKIDVLATDHAPHLLSEKKGGALKAASGGPLLQHTLLALLSLVEKNKLSLTDIVTKAAHNPAILFGVEERGFLRQGYYADLVLIDPTAKTEVKRDASIISRCGWSPFEGCTFPARIVATYVNGSLVYDNGKFAEERVAMPLRFK